MRPVDSYDIFRVCAREPPRSGGHFVPSGRASVPPSAAERRHLSVSVAVCASVRAALCDVTLPAWMSVRAASGRRCAKVQALLCRVRACVRA